MNIFEALECVRAGHQMRHADWRGDTSLRLWNSYPTLVEETPNCTGRTTVSHLHERIPPAQLGSTHWETVAVNGISAREVTFSETSRPLNEGLKTPRCSFCSQRLMMDALGRCALCGAHAGHDLSKDLQRDTIEAALEGVESDDQLLRLLEELHETYKAKLAVKQLTRALERGQRVTRQIVYGPGGRQRARAGAQHTCLDQAGDVVGLAALGRAGTPYVIGAYFDDTRLDAGRRQLDGIRHIIDGLGYKAPEQHESERLRIAVAIEQLQKTFKL